MIVVKQIFKVFTALLLVFALMLPTAIQFSHIYENHEHVICNDDQSIHYHEAVPDCSVCHFHQQSFNYDLISYIEIIEIYNTKKTEDHFSSSLHSLKINRPQLRGPPSILS